jgi:hypothetical protein
VRDIDYTIVFDSRHGDLRESKLPEVVDGLVAFISATHPREPPASEPWQRCHEVLKTSALTF